MATEATKAIEAILMVAQEPVDPHLLAQLLEVSPDRVAELCDELQAAYTRDDRGFVLVKVAGGYRFQSHGDMAPYVERFVLEGQTARLSSAALETLAIVAYKQPISRAQVAAIRGVNVDGVMRTLQQRGYIDEVGRDPGPGQATLFGTTTEFLERLGLASLHDLPPIAELFPDASVLEALEKGLRADPPAEGEAAEIEAAEGEDVQDATVEGDVAGADPADEPGEPEGAGRSGPEGVAPSDEPESHERGDHGGADGGAEGRDTQEPVSEPELPAWFTEMEPSAGTTDEVSDDRTDDAGHGGADLPEEPTRDDRS